MSQYDVFFIYTISRYNLQKNEITLSKIAENEKSSTFTFKKVNPKGGEYARKAKRWPTSKEAPLLKQSVMIKRPNIPQCIVLFVTGITLFFATFTFALSIATWNMEWLSDKGDIIQGKRTLKDYTMMKGIIRNLNADLIAFQEVDDFSSLSRVIDTQAYNIYFSQRAQKRQKSKTSQQYTGWAARKNITVIDHPDLKTLGLPSFFGNGWLRYGTYIEVIPQDGPPLHLLSIHLKSGCFKTPRRRNKNCKKLAIQIDALSRWINERIKKKQEFVIAGDFNHYMNEEDEWVWQKLKQQIGEENLINLSGATQAKCKVSNYNYRTQRWGNMIYKKLIDHIIASPGAISLPVPKKAKQYRFSNYFVEAFRLSDHCPLYVTLG